MAIQRADSRGVSPVPSIILAGGRARRLGESKPRLIVNHTPLLQHALGAVDVSLAVVVGPDDLRPLVAGAQLTREDPPFGGPVAAIAAGLALVAPNAEWVIVLACDIPRARELLPTLLRAVESAGTGANAEGDAEVDAEMDAGVDAVVAAQHGHPQWLLGVYRRAALEVAVDSLRESTGVNGAAVRTLVDGFRITLVDDLTDASHDIDTAADLVIAEGHLKPTEGSTPWTRTN
ncbi:MAG: hypothetical protein JWQ43_3119 [Glaciihabitans sp.]|nr:hypothetical protein [Glaciihabitans sp.]